MNEDSMSAIRQPMPSAIDLGAVAGQGHEITLKRAESSDERAARIAEAARDAELRRRKDWWAFVATLLTSIIVGGAAFVIAVVQTGDLQKWAMSLVTLLLGGAVGYWGGTKSANKASG